MRKRIGILLVNDDVGVAYYLSSIVKSLNSLDDARQPEIILLYDKVCEKYVGLYKYHHLTIHQIDYNKNKKLKYFLSILQQKNILIKPLIKQFKLDGLSPVMDLPVRNKIKGCVVASWIPDFQHKFYPEFFSKKNLLLRETRFRKIIANSDALFLSSNDAFGHLRKFYKMNFDRVRIQVMPFVSMVKNYHLTEYSELVKKYNITTPYFLVSNQFYAHKNHITVLKAIKELKEDGLRFTVYMTGKMEDYRDPAFFRTLTNFISENGLENQARILGLISREDQLGLLKGALSVIQPSKFEGWSTIIEDAKTLQKQIICSDIDVHIEQMGDNAFYFNSDNMEQLAALMKVFLIDNHAIKSVFSDYDNRVREFASTFIEIF